MYNTNESPNQDLMERKKLLKREKVAVSAMGTAFFIMTPDDC